MCRVPSMGCENCHLSEQACFQESEVCITMFRKRPGEAKRASGRNDTSKAARVTNPQSSSEHRIPKERLSKKNTQSCFSADE
jgi:hypothetical protein